MAIVLEDESGTSQPAKAELNVVKPGDPAPARQGEGGSDTARRRRVLVVDDNSGLRGSVDDILSTQGYVVSEAEDGADALRQLANSTFDVVILDLHMPRLSGMEVLRQIEPPPPVVVVCSAFEYITPAELQEQAGVKVFRSLRKPVPPITLLAVVAEAIRAFEDGSLDS